MNDTAVSTLKRKILKMRSGIYGNIAHQSQVVNLAEGKLH